MALRFCNTRLQRANPVHFCSSYWGCGTTVPCALCGVAGPPAYEYAPISGGDFHGEDVRPGELTVWFVVLYTMPYVVSLLHAATPDAVHRDVAEVPWPGVESVGYAAVGEKAYTCDDVYPCPFATLWV
jgi:hypothetical protein